MARVGSNNLTGLWPLAIAGQAGGTGRGPAWATCADCAHVDLTKLSDEGLPSDSGGWFCCAILSGSAAIAEFVDCHVTWNVPVKEISAKQADDDARDREINDAIPDFDGMSRGAQPRERGRMTILDHSNEAPPPASYDGPDDDLTLPF
jgi:hypothetical protein